jgi:hypothetical protein
VLLLIVPERSATRGVERMTSREDSVLRWLLDGDVSIRWQVQRDLLGAPESRYERERRKIASEGWGARLLAKQDAEGTWGGGLYSPKWTSTTYTMLLLRDLGLPPANVQMQRACALLLDNGIRPDGGVNFGVDRRSETCVTGMTLSILSYCQYGDDRLDTIADHLLGRQMDDGGWNCRHPRDATHGSMHTTISVLEGLRLYAQFRERGKRKIQPALRRALEFLLVHQLFRSHRTGTVIKSEFKRFAFPPRWHYDILRALDFFQAVDASRDQRLAESIDILRSRAREDGRWPLETRYKGQSFFDMERVGTPSRWNTLRALRVLKWWAWSA